MTAHEDLRDALAALLDSGDRPPCCWPDVGPWWLSESASDRARAVEHCHGCAILDPCHAAAESTRERFGVYGGRDRTPAPGAKHRKRVTS